MSKVEMVKCDFCGKVSEDVYDDSGWISMTMPGGHGKAIGHFRRDKVSKYATSESTSIYIVNEAHFCTGNCLVAYFEQIINSLDRKREDKE